MTSRRLSSSSMTRMRSLATLPSSHPDSSRARLRTAHREHTGGGSQLVCSARAPEASFRRSCRQGREKTSRTRVCTVSSEHVTRDPFEEIAVGAGGHAFERRKRELDLRARGGVGGRKRALLRQAPAQAVRRGRVVPCRLDHRDGGAALGVGPFAEPEDHGQRGLPLAEVSAEGLPHRRLVAGQVEAVVHDLEGHPEVVAETGRGAPLRGRRRSAHRPPAQLRTAPRSCRG